MSGFRNDSSHCMFVGDRNLDEVIAQDTRELAEIGGSFDAIADRMQELDDWAVGKGYILPHEEQSAWVSEVYDKFESVHGKDWHKNPEAWKQYGLEWGMRMAQNPKTWYDRKVAVVQVMFTRGFQQCPFEGCNQVWSEDVELVSRKSERQLKINRGTAHLARAHHLLEKDNEYGISARDFYDGFMPEEEMENES